jgi:hypothetical protein
VPISDAHINQKRGQHRMSFQRDFFLASTWLRFTEYSYRWHSPGSFPKWGYRFLCFVNWKVQIMSKKGGTRWTPTRFMRGDWYNYNVLQELLPSRWWVFFFAH